ncbi:NDP-sugar synthase [Streptomyces tsukubensis]|uniref:NDP-sugar synthase n=1 Tax=Streptomyces tsukubensis TaxID=83656 RepID=UPI00344D71B1
MRALVLAGGRGSRLAPLTPVLPKPLAPVANRPVLAWVLDQLAAAGITETGVIVPASDVALYETVFGATTRSGVRVRWLAESAPAGTGGCLKEQAAFIGRGPVLVVPADILSGTDLPALAAHHRRVGAAVTVAAVRREAREWAGDTLNPGPAPGLAAGYRFKPDPTGTNVLGSTGAWVVEPRVLDLIPGKGMCDFSSGVLPLLPRPGLELGVFDAGAVYLRDIGTPRKLLTGNTEALGGTAPLALPAPPGPVARVDDGAVLRGRVLLGPGAAVAAGVRITGPAVIGPHARIGAGAVIDRAVVLPGARIAPGARVAGEIAGQPDLAREVLVRHGAEGSRP